MKTCVFFEEGTHAQFEFTLTKYQEALVTKAHAKSSKPENLIKLDKWFQTELPKKIKSRGTEGRFLTHEEIVQCIKWKLARGQFRPRLKDLVQMNTPRVVMQETKKAFRHIYKKNDLESAVQALSNLKGVGPGLASAVLAAGAPHIAPFMADECLLSLPEMEGIDYTLKEYMRLVEKTKECVTRLNSQGGEWNPHTVELAVWTHYIARDLKPELLEDMPDSKATSATKSPAKTPTPTSESPAKDLPDVLPTSTEISSSPEEAETTKEDEAYKTNGVNGVHTTQENSTEEKVEESTKATVTQEESGSNGETSSNSNDTTEKSTAVDTTTAPETTTTNTAESKEDSSTKSVTTTNGDSSATDEIKSDTVLETTSETKAQASTEEKATEQPASEKVAVKEQKSSDNGVTVSTNGNSQTKEIVNGGEEHLEKKDVKATEVSEKVKETSPEKQNGNSSSITKEDTFNGDSSSAKRSLEPEDSDLSESKRLKEDTAAIPHPIQAN